jgi:hypothetical protein
MAAENQKSVAMKVVEKVASQAAIKKKINRRFTKTQPRELTFDKITTSYQDGFVATIIGIGRFIKAMAMVLAIIPAVGMGILEGISKGLLKGLETATEKYRKFLDM